MRHLTPLLLSSFVLSFVLVGCDATGSQDTVVLNANSPAAPTVEYSFRYTSDNVSDNGQRVEVVSQNSDNLGSVLMDNGFSRNDVISATVDSLTLRRESSPTTSGIQPKVFDYLSGASVYLGTDDSGKLIADDQFQTTQQEITLDVANGDVTSEIKGGSKSAFLRLTTSGGEVPSQDVVEVTVYYRIEVQGV